MATVTKLLNKPLRLFVVYSACILFASIPLYFLLVDNIWLEELDENNEIIAGRAKYNLAHIDYEIHNVDSLLIFWNTIQPNSRLIPRTRGQPDRDSIYTIYKGFPHSEFQDIDRFRVLETPVHIKDKSYTLIIESNVEETYETVAIIALVTMMLITVLCVGFVLLNRVVSEQIWNPFKTTLLKVKNFKLEDERLPEFEPSGVEEFENLNSYILQLMEKNIEVFKMQKEFIENVSHEIQTPLAIIQGKLNLAMQSSGISKNQFQLIESANKALSRAVKINRSLLFLAKIDNRQFSNQEEIIVANEIGDIVELLEAEFEQKSIRLIFNIQKETIVLANRELFVTLIQNLITNALRYTTTKGSVIINVNSQELSFQNSGIRALDEKKVFRRFITLDNNKPGTGIGLALVKEICKLNNWRISYHFELEMHFFSIIF